MSAALPVRALAWTLALGLLALPLVGLFMGWFASDRWPVRSLRVTGNFQHVTMPAVRDRVKPLLKPGFFAIDLGAIRQAVAALPWVDAVEVRRQWPDQLVVRVREHRAFARWNDHAMIDRKGRLFAVPDAPTPALPQLRGPPHSTQTVLDFYLDARRLLAELDLAVTGVELNRRGAWRITLADGAIVTVGKAEPGPRLRRFAAAFGQLTAAHGTTFVSADLRYSNGFAVRWSPAATATGGSPPA